MKPFIQQKLASVSANAPVNTSTWPLLQLIDSYTFEKDSYIVGCLLVTAIRNESLTLPAGVQLAVKGNALTQFGQTQNLLLSAYVNSANNSAIPATVPGKVGFGFTQKQVFFAGAGVQIGLYVGYHIAAPNPVEVIAEGLIYFADQKDWETYYAGRPDRPNVVNIYQQ